jgi:hypothetical protein
MQFYGSFQGNNRWWLGYLRFKLVLDKSSVVFFGCYWG